MTVQISTPQRLVPGLIGMATPANAVYLGALQAAWPSDPPGGRSLNRLRTVLYEVDFARLVEHIRRQSWADCERQIADAALALKAAGAGFLVITSATGSTLAKRAGAETGLPILDIVGTTLARLRADGYRRAGLLSTIRTCQSGVFQQAAKRFGIEMFAPPEQGARGIEKVIFEELIYGVVSPEGLSTVRAPVDWFTAQGADSLVLGCTDLTHMARSLAAATSLAVFDTTVLHAAAAARAAHSGSIEWLP